LVLGPFQGPLACTRIAMGKGVCGTAALRKETVLVPDVDQFPGHIACSSLSKSEIVVPCIKSGETAFVLDVDSALLDDFGAVDQMWLERIVALLAPVA
jgi:GAF domain-containing protein